jgi:hypothetical protein
LFADADQNYLWRQTDIDEATVYVLGRVNRHKCRILGSENLNVFQEIKGDSEKVNILYALSCSEVLEPSFFVEE